MQKWIVQGLVPLLCGFVLLLGAIVAGRAARASLQNRMDYTLAFTDIDCRPPEGTSRAAFLSEVRSLAHQPTALRLLDDDLTTRLHRAFLAHPCVESVQRVAITPSDKTGEPASRRNLSVRIEIEYRQAVLAVPPVDSVWRTVDRRGVFLLETAVRPHLPLLISEVSAPTGPPGSRWRDARLTAAAKTAAFLRPHLAELHLEDSQIEVIESEIVFRRPNVRIVWGHAPGQEKEDEAPPQVKLQRLLDYQKEHDGLNSLEHDVRLLAYQGHFPLSPDESRNSDCVFESRQCPPSRNRGQVSNSSGSWRSCFHDAKPPSSNASSR